MNLEILRDKTVANFLEYAHVAVDKRIIHNEISCSQPADMMANLP